MVKRRQVGGFPILLLLYYYYVYVYYDDYGISRIAVYRFLNRLYATPPFEYPPLLLLQSSFLIAPSLPFTDILYYITYPLRRGFPVLCHCHVKVAYTPRSSYVLS